MLPPGSPLPVYTIGQPIIFTIASVFEKSSRRCARLRSCEEKPVVSDQ
nr:MAG TPA: hypothetical protein [Caudoviricetes sp.]